MLQLPRSREFALVSLLFSDLTIHLFIFYSLIICAYLRKYSKRKIMSIMIKTDFKCKKTTLVSVTVIVCLAMSHLHTSVLTGNVHKLRTRTVSIRRQTPDPFCSLLPSLALSAHFYFLLLSGNNWCSMDSVRPSVRTLKDKFALSLSISFSVYIILFSKLYSLIE